MYSRIRHLLYCQDELARLQSDLLKQDDEDASTISSQRLLFSRKRYEYRNDQSPQKAIINKIVPKLKEYGKRCGLPLNGHWLISCWDDLVERTVRLASLRAPDARDLESLHNWMKQQEPLSREERGHLLDGTDFVALVEKKEECWLDNVVERAVFNYFPRDVRMIFLHPYHVRTSWLPEYFHFFEAASHKRQSKPSFA